MSEQADNSAAPERGQLRINWDDSKMQSSYANVCNVTSTREEVTLLFGTNQVWHSGQRDVTVELHHRIVVNPFAAKRLCALLQQVIQEYESRFGSLETSGQVPESVAKT